MLIVLVAPDTVLAIRFRIYLATPKIAEVVLPLQMIPAIRVEFVQMVYWV